MAYIHTKRIGKTTYYTLRMSYRKGKRVVTKDLEQLGTELLNIKIEDLEKKHKKEIRASYKAIKKFLERAYYEEQIKARKLRRDNVLTAEQQCTVEAVRLHYQKRFLTGDEDVKDRIFENFLIKFAVNSTTIEGNTITLEQAAKLLREDILPKDKTLREVFDLKNTKEVFLSLQEKDPPITLDMIEETHDRLLENIDVRKGYRTEDIHILGQPFTPTPGRYVKEDTLILLRWLEKNEKNLHPLALATLFHHKFENIHPFSDGNGRTGRILMNHLLQQKGYPPIVISHRHRKGYLEAMGKADGATKKNIASNEQKHYQELIGFIISEFEESYWDTFLF